MADAESLKSFLIDVGFAIDSGSERRLQESLKRTQVGVERFSRATHQSTGFLGQFFQFFQKSEGPMRRHTETTDKLAKSFDEFGKSLKGLVAIVAGGALTKALLDLNDQFTKLHYTARDAGTSVANLMAEQFGGARVGLSAERITAALTGLQQALITMPNAAKLLAESFKVDIADLVDPITGKIKDTAALFDRLLPRISEMYRQGPLAVNYVESILSSIARIQLTPDMRAVLLDPDLMRKRVEGEAAAKGWAARLGVDLNQAATNAVEVTNRFNDIWYILNVIKGGIEETFGISVAHALEGVRDGLLHLIDVAKQASAGMIAAFKSGGFEGLGQYITQQLDTIDWTAEGATAAQKFVDGMVAFIKAQGPANLADAWRKALSDVIVGAVNQMLNDLREQLQKIPLLRSFPGVGGPAPGELEREKQSGGGRQPADPAAEAQVPRQYQHGGIVPTTGPAIVHAGEGVVTADAMSGLARLGPTIEDLWDGFRNWWFGGGGYRPGVVIANVDELADAIHREDRPVHEANDEGDARYPGQAGGPGPRGSRAIGAPRAPREALGTSGGPLGSSSSPGAEYKFGAFNVGNIGAGPGRRNPAFRSMEEGIQAIAKLLTGYIGSGYDTLNKIINRYSPSSENATSELISAAAKRMGVDPNQRLGVDNIHDLVGATILNEWGGRFPAGYNQGIIDKALGAAPLGTTNSYRAGDKTVTLNAQSNFNITGTDALSVGGAINSVQSRTNADLIRNLSPIVQ